MSEEKSNHFGLLLISIVGIVAIAGLIIMFSGNSATSTDSGNIGGEAIAVGKIETDCTNSIKPVLIGYKGEANVAYTAENGYIKDCNRISGSDSPFVAGIMAYTIMGTNINPSTGTYDWPRQGLDSYLSINDDYLHKYNCISNKRLVSIAYSCTEGIIDGNACKRTPIYKKRCKPSTK